MEIRAIFARFDLKKPIFMANYQDTGAWFRPGMN